MTKPEFTVHASFLEIYGEELRDLLSSNEDLLQIRQDETQGIWIQGLSHIEVLSSQEALHQLRKGALGRVTACTNMNDTSSRSHAVYTITVTQNTKNTDESTGSQLISKLTFVDLAGSERLKRTQAEGERMKEGININGTLFGFRILKNGVT